MRCDALTMWIPRSESTLSPVRPVYYQISDSAADCWDKYQYRAEMNKQRVQTVTIRANVTAGILQQIFKVSVQEGPATLDSCACAKRGINSNGLPPGAKAIIHTKGNNSVMVSAVDGYSTGSKWVCISPLFLLLLRVYRALKAWHLVCPPSVL